MPKTCYVEKTFSPAHQVVIEKANGIIEDYANQGFDLTLRQLYYQFVAADLIPNQEREYKRLGGIVNDARLAGLIDWDAISDRTRSLRSNSHWESPADIVETCARQFQIDKWEDQEKRVEVWIEKDALVGILEATCEPMDVPYFSCRGYSSQSEMWRGAMRLVEHIKAGQGVVVLHLGDHDPSGVDMSRDIEDRLRLFIAHHVGWERALDGFLFTRIALTMDQIEEYEPPPNPAKVTDSRFEAYQELHGDESWELDSMSPTTLSALIRSKVMEHRDEDLWNEAEGKQKAHREELTAVASGWDRVREFIQAGGSG